MGAYPRPDRVATGYAYDPSRKHEAAFRQFTGPGRKREAVRALAERGRPERPCRVGQPLPPAGPEPRAPLRRRPRAVRRPAAGREPRPREGNRPLRRRPRSRILVVCRTDDPRRAEALLPRPRM